MFIPLSRLIKYTKLFKLQCIPLRDSALEWKQLLNHLSIIYSVLTAIHCIWLVTKYDLADSAKRKSIPLYITHSSELWLLFLFRSNLASLKVFSFLVNFTKYAIMARYRVSREFAVRNLHVRLKEKMRRSHSPTRFKVFAVHVVYRDKRLKAQWRSDSSVFKLKREEKIEHAL